MAAIQAPASLSALTFEPLEAQGATVGACVVDAATGTVLLAHHADALVTPASTQKLLTAATVLDTTSDHMGFTTRVVVGADVQDGVLGGDLWLVGDGDPSLGVQRGPLGEPVRPNGFALRVAQRLLDRGIREVAGAVVGDGRVLSGGLPPGWAVDDLPEAYSAVPDGLTFLEGTAMLHAVELAGGPWAVLEPPWGMVELGVEPVQRSGRGRLAAVGTPFEPRVLVRLSGPPGAAAQRPLSMPQPALHAAVMLRRTLLGAGIRVRHPARVATPNEVVPATVLVEEPSPSVAQLLTHTLMQSLNLYAEVMLMQAGRAAGLAPSRQGGLEAMAAMLGRAGVDVARVRLVDGSGLSRMNLVSARDLVRVLAYARQRHPALMGMLPLSGHSGTLGTRWQGTAAEGRIRGKTGTLTGHRNLVAEITTPGGRVLLMAVMINGTPQRSADVDAVVDGWVLEVILAADRLWPTSSS